jgi:NAD(P)-dependent dehydrogenase (short-subunit alcohol dehydrogenase family)
LSIAHWHKEQMMNRFEGRSAVITGGAAGIGLAIAQRIAVEGGQSMIWDRDAGAIKSATSNGVQGHVTDIADSASVSAAMAATMDMLGRVDVLVCSAGITGPNLPTWEYPDEDWKQVYDVNVHGLFYCNKAVVPQMMTRDYGRIVNIASIAGKEGNPKAPAYSSSKSAVIGLTKSLGKELAHTGITVNCITPAAVRTAIFDQMTQDHIDYMLSKIPKGRFGTVDEVAALACWLASEECSFTTSGVFDISGGRATY